MDSISSISFPNEPLISWTQRWTLHDHFCHHFWVGLVLLCCCTHPKVMSKMVKKCSTLCSTDQRFIRKRNTTYRIHTLVGGSEYLTIGENSSLANIFYARSLVFKKSELLRIFTNYGELFLFFNYQVTSLGSTYIIKIIGIYFHHNKSAFSILTSRHDEFFMHYIEQWYRVGFWRIDFFYATYWFSPIMFKLFLGYMYNKV